MNQSEDWDVIWRWQWFRRSLWQPYFRDPTHPEGRPARIAPIWLKALQQAGASRVLDCNCGLGMRAMLLHEAGFDVTGTDSSSVGISCARELSKARDASITFEVARWQELGARFQPSFDAVINDGFAWTLDRAELRFAAHNFASVLKPGGVFLFTGADQWSTPADLKNMIDHQWKSGPRFQLRADYEHMGTRLSLVVARDRSDFGVVENYLFVVRDARGARLETASICNSLEWTWDDYQAVCREAGFSSIESVKVPVGHREHVINVARK